MIRHIVLWRIKEVPDREAALAEIRARILAMKPLIKEIRRLEAGSNVVQGPDAADVVLTSEFDTLEDLAAYQRHPEHLRFVEFMAPLKAEKRVIDYPF